MKLTRRQLRISGKVVALTPLVVPAFSTEADPEDGFRSVLDQTLQTLLGPALVSAIDVASGIVPDLTSLLSATRMPFAILDSGGYELLPLFRSGKDRPRGWSREAHEAVLALWPDTLPAIAVSYDNPYERRDPIHRQIQRASDLFVRHAGMGRCLLLKPPEDPFLKMADVAPHIVALAPFDVIGITEKEAGSSHVERLRLIRALRTALDQAGIDVPLHVFGSLDPFLAPSYFLAGADLFDGLSWIRHGFRDGLLVNPQNHNAIARPSLSFVEGKEVMRRANLRVISDMQVAMQRVSQGASLDELGPLTDRILDIHRSAFRDEPRRTSNVDHHRRQWSGASNGDSRRSSPKPDDRGMDGGWERSRSVRPSVAVPEMLVIANLANDSFLVPSLCLFMARPSRGGHPARRHVPPSRHHRRLRPPRVPRDVGERA